MLHSPGGGGMVMDEQSAKKIIRELKWRKQQLLTSARKLRDANRRIGYLEKRQKELEAVELELSKTRKSLEILEGKHDPEEVERKLKEEIARSTKLSANLLSMKKEIDFISQRYSKASKALDEARDELGDAKKQLSERKNQLQIMSRELTYTKDKLLNTKKTLAQAHSKLDLTEKDLSQTKADLAKTSEELTSVKGVHSKTSNVLSFTKGQLSSTEKQLTDTKKELGETSNKLMQANIDLVGARKKLESMQTMLKSAVSELSTTKRNLNATKGELTSTKSNLTSTKTVLIKKSSELDKIQAQIKNTASTLDLTRKQLADAKKRLENNALKNYSGSVVKLLFSIRKERLIMDHTYDATWYQPVVRLGDKNYLIVNFSEVTGLDQPISEQADIINLKYRITPTSSEEETRVTSMIEPFESDPRACAIAIKSPKGIVPLQPISYSELQKRGIQNLYLFKNGSFGKNSCVLNGRVSMNLDGRDPYLYIRNSARVSDSELKADVGDCVISKQGDFVGIVVHKTKPAQKEQQIAKCFIFPDNIRFNPEFAIPVTRSPGSEYYIKYMRQVDAVRRLIKRRQQ